MAGDKFIIRQGLCDLDPVACGKEACVPAHAYGPATRSHYLLHFVVSGRGKFITPRGEYPVGKNQIFIIRPNEITYYEADRDKPWEYIWLGFIAGTSLPHALLAEDVITAPELRELFFACYGESDSHEGGVGYEAFLCAKLWEMLRLLWRREREPLPSKEGYVQSAMAIMESEYDRELTISDIARQLHLHRSYLSTIFREVTGQSPQQALTQLRMNRAAELLREHGCSVSVTALSVGFADVFSFSRAFKRHFGVAPRVYAKQDKI